MAYYCVIGSGECCGCMECHIPHTPDHPENNLGQEPDMSPDVSNQSSVAGMVTISDDDIPF